MSLYPTLLQLLLAFPANNSREVIKLIDNVSYGIEATTNIYYRFKQVNGGGNDNTNEEIISKTAVAKVIVTNEAKNYEVREHFNADILSIITLRDNNQKNIETLQLKIVKQTLKRLERADILFISEKAQASAKSFEWMQWLFQWCWNNGFPNALLQTDLDLYTFRPFPQVQVVRTTLAEYLQQRNNWSDFKGYPIRVAIGNQPPRAVVYYDKKGVLQLRGICPRYLALFTERFNATFQPILMPNLKQYRLTDCIDHLQARTVDICADGFFLNKQVPISRPQFIYFGYLMVRYPQPVAKFHYFLTPFSQSVWLLLAATVCYVTLAMSYIYWQQHRLWHMGYFFLQVFSSALFLPFNLHLIQGKLNLYLYILLVVAGFIFANLYLTLLSSILSTNVYEDEINTAVDVAAHNITILIAPTHELLYSLAGVEQVIRDRFQIITDPVFRKHRDNLDPNFGYLHLTDKSLMYMYQQKFMIRPRMKLLEQPLSAVPAGMPMLSDWPFEEMFNAHMTRVFELGFYKLFFDESVEDAIRLGDIRFFETEYYAVVPLSIEYFETPAILLGCGYLAAIVSFVLEKFVCSRICQKIADTVRNSE